MRVKPILKAGALISGFLDYLTLVLAKAFKALINITRAVFTILVSSPELWD